MAGKDSPAPDGQGHGDEEAEGGAALPTVQMGQSHAAVGGHGIGSHAVDGDGIPRPVKFRPQLSEAAKGGVHILGVGHIVNNALPLGQGSGDEEPVGLGLGGGRSDGAFQFRGGNGKGHCKTSISRALGSLWSTAPPSSPNRTRVISSPAPFLSWPMAAA